MFFEKHAVSIRRLLSALWMFSGAVMAGGGAVTTMVYALYPDLERGEWYAFVYFKAFLFPLGSLCFAAGFFLALQRSLGLVLTYIAAVLTLVLIPTTVAGSFLSWPSGAALTLALGTFFLLSRPGISRSIGAVAAVGPHPRGTGDSIPRRPLPVLLAGLGWMAAGLAAFAGLLLLEFSLLDARGPGSGGAVVVFIAAAGLMPLAIAGFLVGLLLCFTRRLGRGVGLVSATSVLLTVPLLASFPPLLIPALALGIGTWTAVFSRAGRNYYAPRL